MPIDPPQVLIVDDDPSVCASIKRLMISEGFAARTFVTPRELFAHGRPDSPCCLVLDVRMPDGDGLSFYEQLVSAGIRVPVVFITGHGDIDMSVRAMKAGAMDFLVKPYEPQQLVACVLSALEKDERGLQRMRQEADLRNRYCTLTQRERDVFVAVTSGLLNKQVAYDYGISEKTVKVHRARVMEKMKAAALTDLVRMADQISSHDQQPGA